MVQKRGQKNPRYLRLNAVTYLGCGAGRLEKKGPSDGSNTVAPAHEVTEDLGREGGAEAAGIDDIHGGNACGTGALKSGVTKPQTTCCEREQGQLPHGGDEGGADNGSTCGGSQWQSSVGPRTIDDAAEGGGAASSGADNGPSGSKSNKSKAAELRC